MTGVLGRTSDWPDAGFPGIRINPESLLPQIINEDLCRAALEASTDPVDPILVLLAEGHAVEAAELLAEARYKDPESFQLRAFEAEVLRVAHRYDRAAKLYRQLLGEVQGTPEQALVHQLLGRTYYAAGHISAAVDAFGRALDLRVEASADAALIYASTVALQRARDMQELAR